MVNNLARINILVVDNHEDITWSLSQALGGPEVNASVITAASGREALDRLAEQTINLLIADISMLEVDDLDLFLEAKRKYPAMSAIMLATVPAAGFSKEAVLGETLYFIEKPFDINRLKQLVTEIIGKKAEANIAILAGISFAETVQLKCLAGATATLQFTKGNQQGYVHFRDGEIVNAFFDNKKGEEAFFEILSLGRGMISTQPLPAELDRGISEPGMSLIRSTLDRIEGTARQAEEEAEARRRAAEEEEARRRAEEEAARKRAEEEAARKRAEEEAARKRAEEEEAARKKAAEEAAAEREKRRTRTIQRAVKKLIASLQSLDGFMAAGVLSSSGKMLTKKSADQSLDVDKLGETFNALFRKARRTSQQIGLQACRETIFKYGDRAVLMRCSGSEASIHVHLMVVMSSDIQLPLAGKEIDNFQARLKKELSELTDQGTK